MEHHKRLKLPQPSAKQKQQFFQQVFEECRRTFTQKEYEFFMNCIIPSKVINIRGSSASRKSQKPVAQAWKQFSIADISPDVLTMARNPNFVTDQAAKQARSQKKNARLLTTPTERTRRQLKFDNLDEFHLYRRIGVNNQNNKSRPIGHSSSSSRLTKYNCPEQLLYRNTRYQSPKPIFSPRGQGFHTGKPRRRQIVKESRNEEKGDALLQTVPSDFIDFVKFPKKKVFEAFKLRGGFLNSVR